MILIDLIQYSVYFPNMFTNRRYTCMQNYTQQYNNYTGRWNYEENHIGN